MNEETRVERQVVLPSGRSVRRASWGAIFAGMFVTVIFQTMFTLLGIAVGINSMQPFYSSGLTIGGGIWLMVSWLVSMWVGACVAGRLSGGPRLADGMIHGMVAWSLAAFTILVLMATLGGPLLGGTASLLQGGTSQTSAFNNQAAPNAVTVLQEELASLQPNSGALLPPTGKTGGKPVPGDLTEMALHDPQLANDLAQMEAHGGASKAPGFRDHAIARLASNHQVGHSTASALVNQWDQTFQTSHSQAASGKAIPTVPTPHGVYAEALWGFVALILGLAVAAWGGWTGTASLPKPVETVAAPT